MNISICTIKYEKKNFLFHLRILFPNNSLVLDTESLDIMPNCKTVFIKEEFTYVNRTAKGYG